MRRVFLGLLIASSALLPITAVAQDRPATIEGRVDRLEHEMRAVQRKVFPGSPDGRFVEPEVTPPAANGPAPGDAASPPLADITARVSSLEQQLQRLTDRVEVTQHGLQQLQDAFDSYRSKTDTRLAALEAGAATTATATGAGNPTTVIVTPARPVVVTSAGDPARATLLASIERPHSDDPAEDAYLYGYRLWDAKLYPEAEAALQNVVTTYPKHRRASYAQNLLGRAYLDEGKLALASKAFYANYKSYPDGERAPDSLYFLAQALMRLNKPADACQVYGELNDRYADKLSAARKADVAKGRLAAKCTA